MEGLHQQRIALFGGVFVAHHHGPGLPSTFSPYALSVHFTISRSAGRPFSGGSVTVVAREKRNQCLVHLVTVRPKESVRGSCDLDVVAVSH